MSRNYYYFAASLPTLSFEGRPPQTTEQFLDDCQRLLVPEDYLCIEALFAKGSGFVPGGSGVFSQWSRFHRDFLNAQAWFRAEARGKDPLDYVREERSVSGEFSEILQSAAKADHPLEAERIIDRFKWKFLEELETHNVFNFGFIVIYAMKLRILQKYEHIDSPKGLGLLKEMCLSGGKVLGAVTGLSHDIEVTKEEGESSE